MKSRKILLAAILLLSTAVFAYGQENELGVTLDVTYVSKWLSKGAEAYGQHGGIFKTLDLDLFGTGFGVKVTHRNSTSSGYVDEQRFDYRPYYNMMFFDDKPYATKFNLSMGYEHYPGLSRHKANTTYEWIFAFSWPDILPKGLVPCYTAHYEYPANSGEAFNYITGWVHRFGLGLDVDVEELPSPIKLSAEVAYTDGLGGASHDWSYAVFGVSTIFDLNENIVFIPGVYQQISMDDSVNSRDDITYCMMSMRYKF